MAKVSQSKELDFIDLQENIVTLIDMINDFLSDFQVVYDEIMEEAIELCKQVKIKIELERQESRGADLESYTKNLLSNYLRFDSFQRCHLI